MFKKITPKVEKKEDKKAELIALLKARTPHLFDRDPVLTGNVVALADEILELLK